MKTSTKFLKYRNLFKAPTAPTLGYPKRWIKALSTVIMAFVVVTEAHPYMAIGVIIKRLSFLLLPLSVLFIKYYQLFPFSRCSATITYMTGTTNVFIMAKSIPPNEGIAMGIIISAPRPVEVKTGIKARMVVATVIKAGLILRLPALAR